MINCSGCTECCAYIPVTTLELASIRRAVRKMPDEEKERLRNQKRKFNDCPMIDVENKRCSIYESRPLVCQMFGYYEMLQCSYNKHIKLKSPDFEMSKEMMSDNVGMLGMDYTWASDFRKVVERPLEKIELTYEDGEKAAYDKGVVIALDGDDLDIQFLNIEEEDKSSILKALMVHMARLNNDSRREIRKDAFK